MREILFRGKPLVPNGSAFVKNPQLIKEDGFIYGHLGVNGDAYSITPIDMDQYSVLRPAFKVIPETVGEYTGFKDMNGKMIFEDDIVYNHIGDKKVVDRIIFLNGCFCMDRQAFDYEFTYQDTSKFEVIGNFHDNPEILDNINNTQKVLDKLNEETFVMNKGEKV